MKVNIPTFENGTKVALDHVFCVLTDEGSIVFGKNINPKITWSDFPKDTKSFALICVDPDVPSVGTDVNIEGRTVSVDLPRVDFYHWLVCDIPLNVNQIESGDDSQGITKGGKTPSQQKYGGTTGMNDYTNWFADDDNMKGIYGGYDGPCPPWNDEKIHQYYFKVFALDIETLGLEGNYTGVDLVNAVRGHILDFAEWVGTYSLNKNIAHTI